MKTLSAWAVELAGLPPAPGLELLPGRDGEPTLRAGDVYLHSRYRPREEAARLVESAALDLQRPVFVVGLGLGYHVRELLEGNASLAVYEPDPAVVKLAAEGPLRGERFLVGTGAPDAAAASPEFASFAATVPQVLVHPPTARLHPEACDAIVRALSRQALLARRLRIAVVGPMYGGSLPIAGYLERAFRNIGHNALFIDNSPAYTLYRAATEGLRTKAAAAQLGNMLANFLGEWSYARAAEFSPDICIVMAQAPVGPSFPARLAKDGVVTAYWFVENWRHMTYWKDIAPRYDCFFHIQPGAFEQQLDAAGCPFRVCIQTGCDPAVHRPMELSEEERAAYECDIAFAGAGYNNRVQLFKGLTDYHFGIWGTEWTANELAPFLRDPGQRFTAEVFARIVAGAKISLNLHSSAVHDGVDPQCDAVNPRVFEIAACGGFQLCDPCAGLDRLFDLDAELPTYRNIQELRARIDYFLARPDEREAIARRARERALRDHTYDHRARQMLEALVDRYGARLLRKGVRIQRTMADMAERAGRDTPLGLYLASLPPDLLFTQESINQCLDEAATPRTYPEKLFTYLREVRNFAETLLAAR